MASLTENSTQFVDDRYKVRLVSSVNERIRVVFDVTPTFSESRSVQYTELDPIHMPGTIQVYKGTRSRTFSIGIKFISRTREDATKNAYSLQILRSWTMPYFGSGSSKAANQDTKEGIKYTAEDAPGEQSVESKIIFTNQEQAERAIETLKASTFEMLGAPPEVLYLTAYSSSGQSNRKGYVQNINKVPVVVTSLSITYPDDVDYIPSYYDNQPFPTKMDVTVEVSETHSPRAYEKFSLQSYRAGKLSNF